jgi:hypothetical protein
MRTASAPITQRDHVGKVVFSTAQVEQLLFPLGLPSLWDFVASGSGTQSHQVLVFPGDQSRLLLESYSCCTTTTAKSKTAVFLPEEQASVS